MKALDVIALILVIVGGLNWGLVGVFDLNVVNKILGSVELVETIVYIAVGVAAIYTLLRLPCLLGGTQKPESAA